MTTSFTIDAFIATDYIVGGVTIRVGHRSFAVDRLLASARASSCAFITAWNPFSTATRLEINRHRDQALRRDLRLSRIDYLEGVGHAGDRAERSVVAFGISRARAAAIGRRYRQDAIIYVRRDRPAELVILRWINR